MSLAKPKAEKPLPATQQNRLIAALSPEQSQRLMPQMTFVTPKLRDVLYEDGRPIEFVYFPVSGVVSIVKIMDDGAAGEIGTIGSEGFVGIPVSLGIRITNSRAIQQVVGAAWRLPVADFERELSHDGRFGQLVRRSTYAFLTQVSQSAVCNRLHPVEERLARWLLMTQDRVGANELSLTHEFLAQMLGVRRPTVTVVAGTLQKAGLIHYTHGQITVMRRDKLEQASCECYFEIRDEYNRLLTV